MEIFDLFSNHGNLKELVIPPKRNEHDKRFGLERFKDVEDIRLLAVKLDNIFIDNIKIHANVRRFNMHKVESKEGGIKNHVGDTCEYERGSTKNVWC